MTKFFSVQDGFESFEYHGNTIIEHVKSVFGRVLTRDWLIFDSVEEAQDYFNADCDR